VPAFRVKLGANDLNCVDMLLNHTHSLTHSMQQTNNYKLIKLQLKLFVLQKD